MRSPVSEKPVLQKDMKQVGVTIWHFDENWCPVFVLKEIKSHILLCFPVDYLSRIGGFLIADLVGSVLKSLNNRYIRRDVWTSFHTSFHEQVLDLFMVQTSALRIGFMWFCFGQLPEDLKVGAWLLWRVDQPAEVIFLRTSKNGLAFSGWALNSDYWCFMALWRSYLILFMLVFHL